jgi:hypothetical protein
MARGLIVPGPPNGPIARLRAPPPSSGSIAWGNNNEVYPGTSWRGTRHLWQGAQWSFRYTQT